MVVHFADHEVVSVLCFLRFSQVNIWIYTMILVEFLTSFFSWAIDVCFLNNIKKVFHKILHMTKIKPGSSKLFYIRFFFPVTVLASVFVMGN